MVDFASSSLDFRSLISPLILKQIARDSYDLTKKVWGLFGLVAWGFLRNSKVAFDKLF